ncbi:8207_t:CDS:2, partial [Entrophospora sp. SA101]
KDDYVDEEILSAVFPLSWDFHFRFHEIFNMMEYIILSVMEYSNVVKDVLEISTNKGEELFSFIKENFDKLRNEEKGYYSPL